MNTEQLAQLIARKQQVLEMLVQVARRQREFIDGGDMTTLLKLLSAKQSLIAQLQLTERQLDPFRAEDPERRSWRSADDRLACQQASVRCDQLLAELLEIERHDESEMVRRRDVAASHLQGVHSAQAACSAYGTATLPSPAALNLNFES